ncbi:hypothetical protein N657DRAFT_72707 [Parathielavia appendiculata]|uniref:Uncharacterized protein n=1 Tax=Parathielavia appendiculata TaxID=2587402 RepID=A0AAN6Z905_9PEZI|nr:hypothetical protein N657DRAFT_72707 [Parathielavia appendiculata]
MLEQLQLVLSEADLRQAQSVRAPGKKGVVEGDGGSEMTGRSVPTTLPLHVWDVWIYQGAYTAYDLTTIYVHVRHVHQDILPQCWLLGASCQAGTRGEAGVRCGQS